MKNAITLLSSTLVLLFAASTQLSAQFDSLPFHSSKKSNDNAVMGELDLGGGLLKDKFYVNNFGDPTTANFQTRYHLFYKVQAVAYWPAVKIGKTGSFGPTIGAGIGFTRRKITTMSLPIGAMVRFGNNATRNTKKAWGYGLGFAFAPTQYFEREYPYGGNRLVEPMLVAQLSTQKFTLRADFLIFPMEIKSGLTSKIIFDSDFSLTLSYSFGDLP